MSEILGPMLFLVGSSLQLYSTFNSAKKERRTQTQRRICSLSAPGKALIAGGYLVLDHGVGVTVGSTARFFSTVACLPLQDRLVDGNLVLIRVESPQFHLQFEFTCDIHSFDLKLVSDSRNDFIEKCLAVFFAFIQVHLGPRCLTSVLSDIRATGQLGIKLRADNDFYSQIDNLRSRGLPLDSSSLSQLPRFQPCPTDPSTGAAVVVKTGMGSSAALTTALVGSLLHFFGAVDLTCASPSVHADARSVVHGLAQLAHAAAQGKIGSGFDVAAAVYGSQLYRRFAPGPFAVCMEPGATPAAIHAAVMARDQWTHSVVPLQLPPLMQLVMGDVAGGSSSTSMAREVLRWRREKSGEAEPLWQRLAVTNQLIAQAVLGITNKLQNASDEVVREVEQRALTGIDWASTPDTFEVNSEDELDLVLAELSSLRKLFGTARRCLKTMGECAGVGIEPDSQTALVDATERVSGVLCAGVPGAGGVDAVYAIVLSDVARRGVEALWLSWTGIDSGSPTTVCPLMLKADSSEKNKGVREEKLLWE